MVIMKILLIRRGACGDILMTTPLLRQLRQAQPKAQLDYCVAAACAEVLQLNRYLDSLIVLENQVFSAKGIFKLINYIYSIRTAYDYIFILGKNCWVNCLFKLTRANLIGFARDKISPMVLDHYVIYHDVERYQGDYYLDLLACSQLSAGVNYKDNHLDLKVSAEDQATVKLMLKRYGVEDFIVVTNSGGNNQFDNTFGIRMIPEDKLLALLEKLLNKHKKHKIILLGGTVDQVNYARYLAKLSYPQQLINCAGKLTIAQSTYLLSQAQHFYVTDCGALHFGLAAGMSKRMTGLFGPTNPAHVIAANSGCRVIWNDQDIFNSDYQLYGTIKPAQFFTKLNLDEVIQLS
jgi:ADP-heptose:LPS heptosyltransferase